MANKKEVFNYYESELSKIKTDSTYPVTIKLIDGEGNQTKTLSLNAESIAELNKLFNKILLKGG